MRSKKNRSSNSAITSIIPRSCEIKEMKACLEFRQKRAIKMTKKKLQNINQSDEFTARSSGLVSGFGLKDVLMIF